MLNLIYGITAPFFWIGYIYQHIFQAHFDGRVRAGQHLVKLLEKAGKIEALPKAEPNAYRDLAKRDLH